MPLEQFKVARHFIQLRLLRRADTKGSNGSRRHLREPSIDDERRDEALRLSYRLKLINVPERRNLERDLFLPFAKPATLCGRIRALIRGDGSVRELNRRFSRGQPEV